MKVIKLVVRFLGSPQGRRPTVGMPEESDGCGKRVMRPNGLTGRATSRGVFVNILCDPLRVSALALPTLLLLLLLLALALLPAAVCADNTTPTASRSSPLTVCVPRWDPQGGRLPPGMSDDDLDEFVDEYAGLGDSDGSNEPESGHVARGESPCSECRFLANALQFLLHGVWANGRELPARASMYSWELLAEDALRHAADVHEDKAELAAQAELVARLQEELASLKIAFARLQGKARGLQGLRDDAGGSARVGAPSRGRPAAEQAEGAPRHPGLTSQVPGVRTDPRNADVFTPRGSPHRGPGVGAPAPVPKPSAQTLGAPAPPQPSADSWRAQVGRSRAGGLGLSEGAGPRVTRAPGVFVASERQAPSPPGGPNGTVASDGGSAAGGSPAGKSGAQGGSGIAGHSPGALGRRRRRRRGGRGGQGSRGGGGSQDGGGLGGFGGKESALSSSFAAAPPAGL